MGFTIYQCIYQGCDEQFSTFEALQNHLENEERIRIMDLDADEERE